MRLVEVAYVTQTKLVDGLTVNGEHVASIEGLEVINDGMLGGAVGFGATECEARIALAKGLCWVTVTNGGTCRPRNEFPLPAITI
jgi:hypothetical protein